MCPHKNLHTNVHIAALFITVENWKQPKCQSTREWIDKIVYPYNGTPCINNKEQTIDTCYIVYELQKLYAGNSLAAQWLKLRDSTAGGLGSIPDRGTKIPHASSYGQKPEQNKNIMLSERN